MIEAILLFVCFAGFVFIFNRRFGIPFAIAPGATVSVLIVILFGADFAGILGQTAYALYLVGWAGFVYLLYLAIVGRASVLPPEAARLAVLALLGFLWLYRVNSGAAYHEWDEFSHWGSVVKAIYSANTFHFEVNPLYFQDYPPGTALFSYFVLKLLGYSEGKVYFSYGLILLAFSLPVIGLVGRRGLRWTLGYCTFIAILVSRHGLGQGWSTTGIDHILSVIFGGTIATYFLLRREDGALWPIAAMLIVLVLTKHAGQSLSLLVAAICAADLLVGEWVHDRRPWLRLWSAVGLRTVLTTICLLAPALLVAWFWRHYVVEMGLAQGFGRFGLSELLAKSAQCCSNPRDIQIVAGFMDKILGLPNGHDLPAAGSLASVAVAEVFSRIKDLQQIRGFSPALLFALFSASGVAVMFRTKGVRERTRIAVATLILSSGAIAFSLSLLLFYLYAFSDYEARLLASFARFQETYFLGWALAAMALIGLAGASAPAQRHPKRVVTIGLLILGLLPLAFNDQTLRRLHLAAPGLSDLRASVRQWVLPQLTRVPESAPIYIVWQGSNGFEFWLVRHEALPRKANTDCYSLGPPHFENDIWSCPRKESELLAELEDYQFLIVAHGLPDLKANYPSLLSAVPSGLERGLLKIDKGLAGEGVSVTLLPDGN